MRIPRDLSGSELEKLLKVLGYKRDHQTGSHIRLKTELNGNHSLTIPNHAPIKIGTLNAILHDLASHHKETKEIIFNKLFSKN